VRAEFTPAALEDVEDAVAWYRAQGGEVLARFRSVLDGAVEQAIRHPEMSWPWRIIDGGA
jgi:plasmid stabilization system protein ParE